MARAQAEAAEQDNAVADPPVAQRAAELVDRVAADEGGGAAGGVRPVVRMDVAGGAVTY